MTVGEAIKEQKDFIARKYHIFRCSNSRLKEFILDNSEELEE